jgi:predicted nucleic acid-binding protein
LRYVLDTTVASALMRAEPGPSSRILQKRPADVLAIAHDAAVVTRNTRHFVRIRSLRVEDWT